MNLKGFISITGKPGLYKVVGQGKDRLIVESLTDGKRMPAFASQRISALEDITMYTTEDDAPLGEIIQKIFEKEKGEACINPNEDPSKLHAYFAEILPSYDKERVYNSDLKKLFAWYNLLQSTGTLAKIAEEEKAEAKKEKTEKKTEVAEEKNEDDGEKKEKKTAAKTKKKSEKPAGVQPKLKEETKSRNIITRKATTTTKRGA